MNHCTKEELIAFETRIAEAWNGGDLPYLVHLSGGNEDQLIRIFKEVQSGDWVFASHRNHYHYLLAGGSPGRLEKLIRTGQSMFVYEAKWQLSDDEMPVNFFTSSILGGTCGIAAGVAWEINNRPLQPGEGRRRRPHVWCFLGDGAEEEGHFYEAALFVNASNLPCTFIIEDNDRSVDTDKAQRRGVFFTSRLPFSCVHRYQYIPTYPHAGTGVRPTLKSK